MADKEKDVPQKEQDDGTLIAKVDLPEEIEDEEVQKPQSSNKEDDENGKDEELDNAESLV